MTNAISMERLTKHYGEVHALTDVTLDVPAGTVFGFLGPNGAGKTTALKVLAGLARPTAGTRHHRRSDRLGSRRPPPSPRLPGAGPSVLRLDDRPRDIALRRRVPPASVPIASARSASCSTASGSPKRQTDTPRPTRAACASVSGSPRRSSAGPPSSCSTSRSPRSTRSVARTSST